MEVLPAENSPTMPLTISANGDCFGSSSNLRPGGSGVFNSCARYARVLVT